MTLNEKGFHSLVTHGDKSQDQREWVLRKYKEGKYNILVATDVAARGLDVKDIKVVLNYDLPLNIEDLIHRVGRTGRAGKEGRAISFICSDNKKMAKELVKVLRESNQDVPPQLDAMKQKNDYVNPRYQRRNNNGGGWGQSRGGYGGNRSYGGGNRGGYDREDRGYGGGNRGGYDREDRGGWGNRGNAREDRGWGNRDSRGSNSNYGSNNGWRSNREW